MLDLIHHQHLRFFLEEGEKKDRWVIQQPCGEVLRLDVGVSTRLVAQFDVSCCN